MSILNSNHFGLRMSNILKEKKERKGKGVWHQSDKMRLLCQPLASSLSSSRLGYNGASLVAIQ